MKTFVIVSLLLISSLSFAEPSKGKYDGVVEKKLDEIISCGYAIIYYKDINGYDYICYGEINRMDFTEKTSCQKVKAEFDRVTNRPSKITYITTTR